MTPLPKRRHSTRRGGKRTAALLAPKITNTICSNCRRPKLPHRLCPTCGYYNGRVIVQEKKSKEHKGQ